MGVEDGERLAYRPLCEWVQALRPNAQVPVSPGIDVKQVPIGRPGFSLAIHYSNPSALRNRLVANWSDIRVQVTGTDVNETKPAAIGRKGVRRDPVVSREQMTFVM